MLSALKEEKLTSNTVAIPPQDDISRHEASFGIFFNMLVQ